MQLERRDEEPSASVSTLEWNVFFSQCKIRSALLKVTAVPDRAFEVALDLVLYPHFKKCLYFFAGPFEPWIHLHPLRNNLQLFWKSIQHFESIFCCSLSILRICWFPFVLIIYIMNEISYPSDKMRHLKTFVVIFLYYFLTLKPSLRRALHTASWTSPWSSCIYCVQSKIVLKCAPLSSYFNARCGSALSVTSSCLWASQRRLDDTSNKLVYFRHISGLTTLFV